MNEAAAPLRALAERWAAVPAGERANYQLYLRDLADALGVTPPQPRGSGFEFEYPLPVTDRRTGREGKHFIDLYRRDHFVLEAKHAGGEGLTEAALRAAYAQAKHYTVDLPHASPPFLLVLDLGRTLLAWDRWSGSYGGFNLARRIDLRRLAVRPDDADFLRTLWENPSALDTRRRAVAVTREVAARLAELSGALEGRGHEPERVARFLIRCVFTMFAEDVGLLPDKPFQQAIEAFGAEPEEFAAAMTELWRAMDTGARFGLRKLLRFNGHFFHDAEALPLTRAELVTLLRAAKADWRDVEPTIFGTLLVRALDPAERHRLGAEYTPRAYVERVVRQTVEVPLRKRWGATQAETLQLLETGRPTDRRTALERLRTFHAWLRSLRFLDPACGSGNFLYVTLHLVKRIELEIVREIERITGQPELGIEEVGPAQFHGIEVKPWAREIAELTLWIGYHQFWKEHHQAVNPPEPVLRDTGTLELRDAVLAWDEIVHLPERDRLDPTPRIVHPVTGKRVPDPEARLPYHEYRGARQAEWPRADFIVGNPPYIGRGRQRDALGDGYVNALRQIYPDVPDNGDLVMYWWHRAAEEVAAGRTMRAGLITTNTITQRHNREVIERAQEHGVGIAWAVADHPWVDESGGAAVRVAMTVFEKEPNSAVRVEVDEAAAVVRERRVDRLNADLSVHANVAGAASQALAANASISSQGFTLVGEGFRLSGEEGIRLLGIDAGHAGIVRPIVNGRDLTARPRGIYTIDFGLRDQAEASHIPILYDVVRDRVKPSREANNDRSTRERWWRFGRNREDLRQALDGLSRYIATTETAKHAVFLFLPATTAAEHSVVCIASNDAFHLGVLSSTVHVTWALAAGGRLGMGNDARYQKALTFDPFPFPDPQPDLRSSIADVADRLDAHRKAALARDERVTMTGMYNVVEKLRSGEPLTAREREIHEIAACGVLRDLHDTLDARVAEAYGWPWPLERDEILERLVASHDERVEEEARGHVRWLRPDYQLPRFGRDARGGAPELALPKHTAPAAAGGLRAWPESTVEQI
ncbi:MAG: class I SAM-dependent DNA methyltransferase, partial [Gemmatimonadota bacterium]|nr:class I SAM-dependent DNA methyltransferase [Gemmatimonadota bacterium]